MICNFIDNFKLLIYHCFCLIETVLQTLAIVMTTWYQLADTFCCLVTSAKNRRRIRNYSFI